MNFQDGARLSSTRRTSDGYMIADAFAVRTGIQVYQGKEVDRPDLDSVRVYRPADEVKSPASLQSFSHTPITMGHPKVPVTADNWKELSVGEVSTEAVWQDNKIKIPLILKDAQAIESIAAGTKELSAGYTCTLDWAPGVTEDGEAYDAVQRNIKINHLAVVRKGRAGAECRIGDEADADNWGVAPISQENTMTMKTMVFGDQAVQVLATDEATVKTFLTKLVGDHAKEIGAKDTALAQKDAKIADLESKVLSDAALDTRVVQRAQLLADAALIAPKVEFVGLSDNDVRTRAIAAVSADYAARGQAFVDAMFEIKLADAKVATEKAKNDDPAMRAALGRQAQTIDAASDPLGQTGRETRILDAWKDKE